MLNTITLISALTDFLAAGRHKKLDIQHSHVSVLWQKKKKILNYTSRRHRTTLAFLSDCVMLGFGLHHLPRVMFDSLAAKHFAMFTS